MVALWAVTFAATFALLLVFSIRDTERFTGITVGAPFDGGFESGLSAWQAPAGTDLRRSHAEARFGRASARVSASTAGPYGLFWQNAARRPAEGEQYEIVAWLKGSGKAVGNRAYVQMNQVGGPSPGRALLVASGTLRSGWTRVRGSGTVVGERRLLDVYVFVPRPRARGGAMYVDGISLRRANGAKR